MSELHQALISREDMSFEEADEIVQEMKERVREGENPEDVLFEEGFEPDYFYDII